MAALVPALVLIAYGPQKLPGSYLILALAFAMSWLGDSLAWALGGSWAAFYVWVPIQIGLVLIIVTEGPRRWHAMWLLSLFAIISTGLTFPEPELLVTALGGLAVVLLARGPLRYPIYLYFGYGTVLYLMMVSGEFMQYWYGYQVCRIGAFVVFIALVVRGRHVGVPD